MVNDEYYGKILQKLGELAKSYGIKLCIEHHSDPDVEQNQPQLPEDFTWGPQGDVGFSTKARLVYAYDPMPEILLHEIVHCILGEPSRVICEAYLLMPFELELAKWLVRGESWADYFLKCVIDYQLVTEVGYPGSALREWGERYMFLRFWRRGIKRARRLGLLNGRNEPTFGRPRWIGSGVCPVATYWNPDVDSEYA